MDLGYALVDWVPGSDIAIPTQVAAYIPAGDVKGPGLAQDDAVQLATGMAMLRDGVTLGHVAEIAVFNFPVPGSGITGPQFKGVHYMRSQGDIDTLDVALKKSGYSGYAVVGKGPLWVPASRPPPGGSLPADWPIKIALAIDNTLKQLDAAPQGGAIPQGYGSTMQNVAAPVVVGIIVAGAAVAVIGTVAAWRYLDPALRAQIAAINAAGQAYKGRLDVLEKTGTMPPPSPIETANADAIVAAAKGATKSGWIKGVAIAGGVTLGVVGLAALQAKYGKRHNPRRRYRRFAA